jgi:DNA gyrase subunit A
VRVAGRNTQGVRIFKTDAEERVVSVEHIPEESGEGGEDGDSAGGEEASSGE